MSELTAARLLCAAPGLVCLALSALLFLPGAERPVRALPRAPILGEGLAALCWIWVAAELILHPIDFLAFLSPATTVILCAACTVMSWLFLRNLLCARALGGLMMLWPMPVILAVRDFVTVWRLMPVCLGYVSLTAGMVVVFHPWTLRAACGELASNGLLRKGFAAFLAAAGGLCVLAAPMLGKAVGE